MKKIYDVVILGAGPVGLATAIGLHKHGIENVLVIDQTRTFRQVGHGLDLLPNGLKALKCLDSNAYEEVRKTSVRLFNPQQSNNEKTVKTNQEQKPPNTSPRWVYKNLQGGIAMLIPNKALNPATTTGADNTTVNSGNKANTPLRSDSPSTIIPWSLPCPSFKSTMKGTRFRES
ncbi:MAG: FAD-dependent monooxygenase [Nostoc sp. DedQUE09]|nr:FAD-dependent monooxygenase [Nostoc sp. DedQUE09]MDZ7954988.1 FAD-dependent monooxygenase [Nostoc sp. DedQUE09]